MSYSDFTSWMFNLERFGIKLGLENTTEFMARLGNPHKDFKSVHVTGTNGKGSVCVMLSEMLMRHGLKVGLYTSPHLVDFTERIRVNGRNIPQEDVVRLGLELKREMDDMASQDKEKQLTFFEFTTGMAFKHFSEMGIDIAVVEVGMGGRLDATNVISPEVSVITRIGLEHTNYLGETIRDIAREKAGIIKPGVPLVTCERKPEALDVISTTCRKKGAPLRLIGNDFDVSNILQTVQGTEFDYEGERTLKGLRTRLLGGYQAENAAAAMATAEQLSRSGISLTDEEIIEGLGVARWPGRLEIVSRKPLVIFDGGHNPDGVATTLKVLTELDLVPLTFVIGCMDDKDVGAIVRAIAPKAARIVSTQAKYKRALPVNDLSAVVAGAYGGDRDAIRDSSEALDSAYGRIEGKGMCVIGSLYLVGEAMEWWGSRRSQATHKV